MKTKTKVAMWTARRAARDVAREQLGRAKGRLDPAADLFKVQTAELLEGVAGQIRHLGDHFHRAPEAHLLARRLERSADYVRYRPVTEMADEAMDAVRENRVLWITAGALCGLAVYALVRSNRAE